MTQERIAEIRARVDRATAGPWKRRTDALGNGVFGERVHLVPCREANGTPEMLHSACNWPEDVVAIRANFEFIAASRTDVPDLLDALTEARARIEEIGEVLGDMLGRLQAHFAYYRDEGECEMTCHYCSGTTGRYKSKMPPFQHKPNCPVPKLEAFVAECAAKREASDANP